LVARLIPVLSQQGKMICARPRLLRKIGEQKALDGRTGGYRK
jgi:hypothetical protein